MSSSLQGPAIELQQRFRIDALEHENRFLKRRLEQIADSPKPTARVLDVGEKTVLLSMGANFGEAQRPDFPLEPGDAVHLASTQHGPGGIVDVMPDPPTAGSIEKVVDVVGDRQVEVETKIGTRLVLRGKCSPRKGDRVVLDPQGLIVIRNLGPASRAPAPETGVRWDDVGGQDDAVRTLREAIEGHVQDADRYRRYRKRRPAGALLCGPPGCVDGDAVVTVNRAGKSFTMSLMELVRRFNGHGSGVTSLRRESYAHCECGGRCKQCGQRWLCATQRRRDRSTGTRRYAWDDSIPTMIRCLWNGEFRLRRLLGAHSKGRKAVVRLRLRDGKSIRVTADHEICREGDIWTRADALWPGARVVVNGLPAETFVDPSRYLHKGYWIVCAGLSKHPAARKNGKGGYERPEHALVMEAKLNDVSYSEWLESIRRGDVYGRKWIPEGFDVHHRDEDTTNNEPDNLELKTKSKHRRDHAIEGAWHRHIPVFLPKIVEVESIEQDGEAEVFDLTVEEAHNFVANGIVVHNCGKTMLAKAAATAIADLHGRGSAATGFCYIRGPELLNKFVGDSEQGLRRTFEGARAHYREHGYPAILCFDEADAILGRRGAGRQEGMERTMVPMFLAEMDGIEETGAFVMVLTNRPDTLDPAVVREGRLDLKILMKRPGEPECAAILARQLTGVPLDIEDVTSRRDAMGEIGAREIFAPRHAVYCIRTKSGKGDRRVNLSHWASGAMCGGLVSRATTLAIRRERETGEESGITPGDLAKAADQLCGEHRILDHAPDLEEIARELRGDLKSIDKV
jgi:ATP-dependent 26S proteasome regulatory subunit